MTPARPARPLLILAAATLVGCGGFTPTARDARPAALGPLSFDVPAAWHRSDPPGYRGATAQWTPDDNDRKESIIVTRSEVPVSVSRADVATLERLLASAQTSLQDVHASRVIPVTTEQGLTGVRIDVDFVPPGQTERYHRVHALLRDGSAIVHVLYTARDPDDDREVFNLVLHTVRHGEG